MVKSADEVKALDTLSVDKVPTIAPGEIVIASLIGVDPEGRPLIDFPGNRSGPLLAMSTLPVTPQHVGRSVALLFANGNLNTPVIMGVIHSPLQDLLATYELRSGPARQTGAEGDAGAHAHMATVDGKRVVIEGQEEIVLKCGEASITLTKAGKIIIRGKYLLNRSAGVNRIMGGSVQIN